MEATKSIFKLISRSILICIVYYLLLCSIEYLLAYKLPLKYFETEADIQAIYVFEYLLMLLITIAIYFFSKKRLRLNFNIARGAGTYFTLIILAILTKIVNDPIYRCEEIVGKSEIIEAVDYMTLFSTAALFLFIKSVILVPIVEEVIFRGYILSSFIKIKKYDIWGVLLSAALFSLIHISGEAKLSAFNIGLVSGVIYLRFGLISAIFYHSIYNFIWFGFVIYPNIYWKGIQFLEFGYSYWLIFLLALTSLIAYTVKSIKFT
jgi:membrane protease YdiL (CAAX protease family)